jgi:hypothetical protein
LTTKNIVHINLVSGFDKGGKTGIVENENYGYDAGVKSARFSTAKWPFPAKLPNRNFVLNCLSTAYI